MNIRGNALPTMGLNGIPRVGSNSGALSSEVFSRTRSQSAAPPSKQKSLKNYEIAKNLSNKSDSQNYGIVMRMKKVNFITNFK